MSYEDNRTQKDAMLKMLMQLEYMMASLNIVEAIMDKLYKETGEQK